MGGCTGWRTSASPPFPYWLFQNARVRSGPARRLGETTENGSTWLCGLLGTRPPPSPRWGTAPPRAHPCTGSGAGIVFNGMSEFSFSVCLHAVLHDVICTKSTGARSAIGSLGPWRAPSLQLSEAKVIRPRNIDPHPIRERGCRGYPQDGQGGCTQGLPIGRYGMVHPGAAPWTIWDGAHRACPKGDTGGRTQELPLWRYGRAHTGAGPRTYGRAHAPAVPKAIREGSRKACAARATRAVRSRRRERKGHRIKDRMSLEARRS